MNGNHYDDSEPGPSSSSGAGRSYQAPQIRTNLGAYHPSTLEDDDEVDVISASDEDEQEELMTLPEIVKAVEQAWQNEKLTADLLVPASLELEHLTTQLKIMEENLETPKTNLIKQLLHSVEVNRLRFLVSSYYRTRLMKIEEFCWYIHAKEEERKKLVQEFREKKTTRKPPESRLMPMEQKYLAEYLHIMEGHFANVALKLMPLPLQKLDRKKLTKEPHLDTFVFFVANKEKEVYEPDQQIHVQLIEGVKYMMRYRLVSDLLTDGSITLV